MGVVEFAATEQTTDTASEKARLIAEALDTLRAAEHLDERESLDRASWSAWYDATIPQVRDLEIVAGAMKIELHRRRGEQIQAEGERRGGLPTKVTHCVPLPVATKMQRSRDRALAAQPARVAEYIKRQAAAGRVPSVRGAAKSLVYAQTTDRKTSQFTARQTRVRHGIDTLLAQIEAIADGVRRTDEQLIADGLDVVAFIRQVRLIPWLALDRTVAGTTFTIDHELRAICDGRAPRPALGHQSLRAYLQSLRAEITRRRKENHDDFRKRNWNSELILKREQTSLLDWIEEQLNRVPN